jgi:hypothetical protein
MYLYAVGYLLSSSQQLANEHTAIFEKLIRAYSLIGEALPRFDRYQATFKDRPELRHVLGLIYSDILEFHSRTYAFFHRKCGLMLNVYTFK